MAEKWRDGLLREAQTIRERASATKDASELAALKSRYREIDRLLAEDTPPPAMEDSEAPDGIRSPSGQACHELPAAANREERQARNRRRVTVLLVSLILAGTVASVLPLVIGRAPLAASGNNLPDLAKRTLPSVVKVLRYTSTGEIEGLGTGFVVSTDGQIVTNYHVIEDALEATVKAGSGEEYRVAGILATDAEHDLVILKTDYKGSLPLTLSKDTEVDVGTDVVVIGCPEGFEGTVSEGIVSAIRSGDEDDYKLLQLTAPISHGSSGSPVVKRDGEVVGVATLMYPGGQAINFAVPVKHVRDLLASIPKDVSAQPLREAFVEAAQADIASDPDYAAVANAEDIDPVRLVEVAKQLVGRYPDHPEAHSLLARGYSGLEFHEEAVAEWELCIALQPRDIASAWRGLASSCVSLGRLSDAEWAFKNALKEDPAHSDTWADLGLVYVQMGQFSDAVGPLRRAADTSPSNAAAWYALGVSLILGGEYEEAVEPFSRVTELVPDIDIAWWGLGVAHECADQYQEALKAYREALAIDTDSAVHLERVIVVAHRLGDDGEAFYEWMRLRKLDPERARELESELAKDAVSRPEANLKYEWTPFQNHGQD